MYASDLLQYHIRTINFLLVGIPCCLSVVNHHIVGTINFLPVGSITPSLSLDHISNAAGHCSVFHKRSRQEVYHMGGNNLGWQRGSTGKRQTFKVGRVSGSTVVQYCSFLAIYSETYLLNSNVRVIVEMKTSLLSLLFSHLEEKIIVLCLIMRT